MSQVKRKTRLKLCVLFCVVCFIFFYNATEKKEKRQLCSIHFSQEQLSLLKSMKQLKKYYYNRDSNVQNILRHQLCDVICGNKAGLIGIGRVLASCFFCNKTKKINQIIFTQNDRECTQFYSQSVTMMLVANDLFTVANGSWQPPTRGLFIHELKLEISSDCE